MTACSSIRSFFAPPTPSEVQQLDPEPAPEVVAGPEKPSPAVEAKPKPRAEKTPRGGSPTPTPVVDAEPEIQAEAPTIPDAPDLSDLYDKGVAAMKRGSHDDALLYWELVWEADPAHGEVTELLKREYQVRGLDAYSQRNIDQAIRLWSKALRIDPEDKKTRAYVSHAEAQKLLIEEIPSEIESSD